MGSLLGILSGGAGGIKSDLFLDFEDAQPNEAEKPMYDSVAELLSRARPILEQMKNYEGAGNEIRQAISNPKSEDMQRLAWNVVCPLVRQLKVYHDYSLEIEEAFPKVLGALCDGTDTVVEKLEARPGLAKTLAHLIHFALTFDDLKMTNPGIQNDFSYYRRTQSRVRLSADYDCDTQEVVNVEDANHMSLFYACPTPMLKTISDSTAKYVEQNVNQPVEHTTDMLSTLAELCRLMVENPQYRERFKNTDAIIFCLRVMVGTVVLYDHTHPVGAFSKKSAFEVRHGIRLLKDVHTTVEDSRNSIDSLMNTLRYTTKHLNDESTPKTIKQMLLQ